MKRPAWSKPMSSAFLQIFVPHPTKVCPTHPYQALLYTRFKTSLICPESGCTYNEPATDDEDVPRFRFRQLQSRS